MAVSGGTAFAVSAALPANSVGSAQLQSGSVLYNKIADNAVGPDKISPKAKAELEVPGPRGPAGPAGPAGSTTTPVTALGTTWVDHSDGTDGTSKITAAGAVLGGTGANGGLANSNDYAGISTTALNGLSPAAISTLSYTESYTMPTDSHFAAPYFKLKLQQGTDASTCGNDDVVYNPSVQSTNLDYAGETETYDITAPYSTVGVDNDANPVDGAYPLAIHSASNGAGADVSGETICLAEIILGGGSAATDATATISNVTVAGTGLPLRTYAFGS